ncbi:hypothetical protein [Bacillus swezeyi]|uniref:hypothetical protein n=1 Tax=Bacillus swezeyi TaxID=1925020 RepID=UPI00384C1513
MIRSSFAIYGANIPAFLHGFAAVMRFGLAFKLLREVRRMNILLLNVWSGLKDIGGELEPV